MHCWKTSWPISAEAQSALDYVWRWLEGASWSFIVERYIWLSDASSGWTLGVYGRRLKDWCTRSVDRNWENNENGLDLGSNPGPYAYHWMPLPAALLWLVVRTVKAKDNMQNKVSESENARDSNDPMVGCHISSSSWNRRVRHQIYTYRHLPSL